MKGWNEGYQYTVVKIYYVHVSYEKQNSEKEDSLCKVIAFIYCLHFGVIAAALPTLRMV